MPLNILVVDDNRVFRDSFCELLNACYERLQIIPAGDGSAALSLTRQISFDLIILDYELTTFSGGDIVRRLRARGLPLPPIILMSAHPDLPVIARLHLVSGYLQKPVDASTLREVLDPFIKQPATRSAGPSLWRIQTTKG
ncbi:response regulator [Roseiflexus sp.]|uniref:response regulator n=1 Tax=Roseiflexus sp. TaxID=2562120 RepID=UPI00398A6E60